MRRLIILVMVSKEIFNGSLWHFLLGCAAAEKQIQAQVGFYLCLYLDSSAPARIRHCFSHNGLGWRLAQNPV
jgi:hypothetical protein